MRCTAFDWQKLRQVRRMHLIWKDICVLGDIALQKEKSSPDIVDTRFYNCSDARKASVVGGFCWD